MNFNLRVRASLSMSLLATVLVMPSALAQKTPPARAEEPLQISLVRTKIVTENGKEVSQSASTAKPGDVLEETATYKNTSKAALGKVEATLPVPPNTELVMASLKPANAKASVDGKVFSDLPLKRKLRQANGVEVEQAVPLAEYRYLRWFPGSLAAGQSLSFSARFKVSDGSPTSTASK